MRTSKKGCRQAVWWHIFKRIKKKKRQKENFLQPSWIESQCCCTALSPLHADTIGHTTKEFPTATTFLSTNTIHWICTAQFFFFSPLSPRRPCADFTVSRHFSREIWCLSVKDTEQQRRRRELEKKYPIPSHNVFHYSAAVTSQKQSKQNKQLSRRHNGESLP